MEYKSICEQCNKEFFYNRKGGMSPASYIRRFCDNCRGLNLHHNTGKNSRWRYEPRYITKQGYVMIRLDTKRIGVEGNYIPEHRLVIEQMLGRSLRKGELVHHKDGNRQNNKSDNLELFVRNGHPTGVRASGLICPHCGKSYSNI